MSSATQLLYFPQWQGTGSAADVRTGAQTLRAAFADHAVIEVPLTAGPLTREHEIAGYQTLVAQFGAATALLAQHCPERLLLLAGDCAAEIAPVAYLNQRYGRRLTVLWFDAHADLNTPASSPSGHFHGMPLRLLVEGSFPETAFRLETGLHPEQVFLVGVRDTDPDEDKFIAAHGVPVHTDPAQLLAALHQQPDYLYIHLDLDVLRPELFPAVQCPVAGGFAPAELAELLRQLVGGFPVVGMSLTESTADTPAMLAPIEPILAVYRQWLVSS